MKAEVLGKHDIGKHGAARRALLEWRSMLGGKGKHGKGLGPTEGGWGMVGCHVCV